jgi:hypothetical protein
MATCLRAAHFPIDRFAFSKRASQSIVERMQALSEVVKNSFVILRAVL